ncbi:hypothetical protein KY331_04415 [Candidatus Woesearchaeota archaeon]|nr:hypothetical protein [Candidatus Woesearchaeota archaeon]
MNAETQNTGLDDITKDQYAIMYDPNKDGFRIDAKKVEELNGMKPHVGKSYSAKAVMDIIRRNFGVITRDNVRREGEHTKHIEYPGAVFSIINGARYMLEEAIQLELTREQRRQEHESKRSSQV